MAEFSIAVNDLELLRIIFQVCEGKKLSPRERLEALSFIMHFDIHIANNWWPTLTLRSRRIEAYTKAVGKVCSSCEGST